MTDPQHIADAIERIVEVDHYLVGLSAKKITLEDLQAAQSVLIDRQNAEAFPGHLDPALDYCETLIKEMENPSQ